MERGPRDRGDDGRIRSDGPLHPVRRQAPLRCPLRDHRRGGEGDGDLREGVLGPSEASPPTNPPPVLCSFAGVLDQRLGGAMESSSGSTQPEEFRLVLSPDLRAGWRARRARRQRFSYRFPARTLTGLIAVVTELVNNAVAHR